MKVTNIEYLVPSQAVPLGNLRFGVEVVIPYIEGKTKNPKEGEDIDVKFSEKTQRLLASLTKSIVKDLENNEEV